MSTQNDAMVATFAHHREAEAAVRKLNDAGLDMRHFSLVGKGYHTEEKVIGFYNTGDRIQFWGLNGALWGGLWGLFFGGIMMTVPMIGPVMVLGHLSAVVFATFEGAAVAGGLGVLGAALYSAGLPKNSVIEYEEVLKANGFLIVAHGSAEEMARARTILEAFSPTTVDMHKDVPEVPAQPDAHAGHHATA